MFPYFLEKLKSNIFLISLNILLLLILNSINFQVCGISFKYSYFLSLTANLVKIPIIFIFLRTDSISKSFLKVSTLICFLLSFK